MKKAAQSGRVGRKRAARVIADPSDLSLVSLVTQICSFSAGGTTERGERDRVHLEGQGLRQTLELWGAKHSAPAVELGCWSSSLFFFFFWRKWGLWFALCSIRAAMPALLQSTKLRNTSFTPSSWSWHDLFGLLGLKACCFCWWWCVWVCVCIGGEAGLQIKEWTQKTEVDNGGNFKLYLQMSSDIPGCVWHKSTLHSHQEGKVSYSQPV